MSLGREELEHRFGRHKATLESPDSQEAHAELRKVWMIFAEALDDILADSRQKSIMFTELETASMWSHKALAESLFNKEGK